MYVPAYQYLRRDVAMRQDQRAALTTYRDIKKGEMEKVFFCVCVLFFVFICIYISVCLCMPAFVYMYEYYFVYVFVFLCASVRASTGMHYMYNFFRVCTYTYMKIKKKSRLINAVKQRPNMRCGVMKRLANCGTERWRLLRYL